MNEAKMHLSRLIQQLRSGAEAEIVIGVADEPVARLVPYESHGIRTLGIDKGLVSMARDFDASDATIAKLLRG
jgi:antitoxin (DNA-binding transcriptional repressor) of toxin-antitoxin stability system